MLTVITYERKVLLSVKIYLAQKTMSNHFYKLLIIN